MLTGNYPFEEELDNMNDFLEIIFPKDIIISEELKNLIRKMLIVDYEKRMA